MWCKVLIPHTQAAFPDRYHFQQNNPKHTRKLIFDVLLNWLQAAFVKITGLFPLGKLAMQFI